MTSVSNLSDKQTLVDLIARYIRTQVRPAAEQRVTEKLLMGDTGRSFLHFWLDYGGDCAKAVEESVKATASGKRAVIARYKAFISWLNRNTTDTIAVAWPPVDTDSRFERLMYIMRTLHECPPNVAQTLADRLWISTRVIEDDLSSIRYADATSDNSFLDTSFVINGVTRSRGSVHFLSTVHPLLLMENLTCVVVLLQSLLEKANQIASREWAMMTAGHVWRQLTDYAKDRVERAIRNAYPEGDPALVRFETLLREPLQGSFVAEEDVRQHAVSQMMYCFKAGLPCRVVCSTDGVLTETHTGTLVPGSMWDDAVRMRLGDGREIALGLDSVVSCEALNS